MRDAASAHRTWRTVPAPRRAKLVARIGRLVEETSKTLPALVALTPENR